VQNAQTFTKKYAFSSISYQRVISTRAAQLLCQIRLAYTHWASETRLLPTFIQATVYSAKINNFIAISGTFNSFLPSNKAKTSEYHLFYCSIYIFCELQCRAGKWLRKNL